MNDEAQNDGNGREFDSNEPTVVISRRLSRAEISRGLRKLDSALGGFRGDLSSGADFVDAGTALGYPTLTVNEATDIGELLDDIITQFTGARAALNRAVGPGPTKDPG